MLGQRLVRNRSSLDKPSRCSARRASSSSRAASSVFTTCSCSSRSRTLRPGAKVPPRLLRARARVGEPPRAIARVLLVLAHDAPKFRVLGLRECDGLPLIAQRCAEPLAFLSQRLVLRDGEFQLSCDRLQLEARILELSLLCVELSLQVRELDVADVEFVREPLCLDQP